MSWVRIDDHAPRHPKLLNAGPLACWMWVCGLAYCSEHLTDGEIPLRAIGTFNIPSPLREATKLVGVGLWERTDTGYRIHDYHEYQPSRDQVETRKQRATSRLEAWRKRQGYANGNADETPLQTPMKRACNAVSNAAPVPVPVPVPIKNVRTARSARSCADGFAAFWAAYPRHENKAKALSAWTHLAPDATLQAGILAAIQAQTRSDQWTRDGGAYIPHPTTWLHGRRWEDELPVARPPTGASARPAPRYDAEDWCHHHPPCNSREYHAVRARDEVEA